MLFQLFKSRQHLLSYVFYFSMLSRCKENADGKVNYVEFLEALKVDVRPGDLIGLSHQIHTGCDEREAIRMGDQMIRYLLLLMQISIVY